MEIKKTLKNTAIIGGLAAIILTSSGCGNVRKWKEQTVNYKSLTGKRGDVQLYSGEKLVAEFDDAKVIYSASDSRTLWLKTKDGKQIYWQGNALVEVD